MSMCVAILFNISVSIRVRGLHLVFGIYIYTCIYIYIYLESGIGIVRKISQNVSKYDRYGDFGKYRR